MHARVFACALVVLSGLVLSASGQPAPLTWQSDPAALQTQAGATSPALTLSAGSSFPYESPNLEVMCTVSTVTGAPVDQTGPAGKGAAPVINQPITYLRYCIVTSSTHAVDVGDIFLQAFEGCPSGNSISADGTEYTQSAYPDLYAAIGQSFGLGSDPAGADPTFVVPNLASYSPQPSLAVGADGTVPFGTTSPFSGTASLPLHHHTGATNADAGDAASVTMSVLQPSLGVQYRVTVDGQTGASAGAIDPIGTVQLTARATGGAQDANTVPADGSEVTSNAALRTALGTTYGTPSPVDSAIVPDLRGKVPIGVGALTGQSQGSLTATLGSPVGAASVTLTKEHVPDHLHATLGNVVDAAVVRTGAQQAYSTIQPSLPLNFIISATGDVLAGPKPDDAPFAGEVRIFAGTSIPAGWLPCDGSSFDGATYPNLAAAFGGSTTLPDLRGRAAVDFKFGNVGQLSNQPEELLAVDSLAKHFHTGTGLVGPGYVALTDASGVGSGPFEWTFTLDVPQTAAFQDTCTYGLTSMQDQYYLPNDPNIASGGAPPNDLTEQFTYRIGPDCTVPTAPAEATGGCTAGATLHPGDSCTYTFDTNTYKVVSGSATLTCPNDGSSLVAPTFGSASDCLTSDLVLGPNVVAGGCTAPSYTQSTSCSVACAAGYSAFGASLVASCAASGGTWTPAAPDCRKDCDVPVVAHSTNDCGASIKQGASCTFTAAAGYFLQSGSTSVTCPAGTTPVATSDAVFVSQECTTSPVTDITASFGDCATSGPYAQGTVCTLGCATGYTLRNTPTRTCSNAAWTGAAADCRADCGFFTVPNSQPAAPLSPNTCSYPLKDGGVCGFDPAPGYFLDASQMTTPSQQVTCTNGALSETPVFASTSCSAVPVTATGAVIGTCPSGSPVTPTTCQLDCDGSAGNRYVKTAGGTYTCANSVWTGTQPTCTPPCPVQADTAQYTVSCSDTLVPKQGDTCTYTATAAYYTSESPTRTCNYGTITPPTYVPIDCGTYVPSGNTAVGTCSSIVNGGTCQLECAAGYTRVSDGNGATTCTNGAWIGTQPTCKHNCDSATLTGITNAGTITCTGGPSSTIAGHGGTCTIAPAANFYLSSAAGTDTLTCTDGLFSANRPTFSDSHCPGFDFSGHSTATAGNCPVAPGVVTSGSVCDMGCQLGVTPSAGGHWTCLNSQWTGSWPVCGNPCTNDGLAPATTVTVPTNGHVVGTCASSINDGESCTFAADTDFYLASGTEQAFCNNGALVQATAVYQSSRCTAASLTVTTPVVIGQCPTTGDVVTGTTCDLACDAGYLEIPNSGGSRICTNGQWLAANGAPANPTCKLNCQPATATGASVQCTSSFEHASTCVFVAQPDMYKVSGPDSLTCDDGAWKDNGVVASFPTFASSKCDPLTPTDAHSTYGDCPAAGRITSSTQCAFGCEYGYVSAGGGQNLCTNTQWTSTPVVCNPTGNLLLVSAPAFVEAGESASITVAPPAGMVALAANLQVTITCDQGSIQCSPNSCVSSSCSFTFPASGTLKSTTFTYTAPQLFSMTPATCSMTLSTTANFLQPENFKIYYGSRAGLTVTGFPATTTQSGGTVISAGTIQPEWAPVVELTVTATCTSGSIGTVYLPAGATDPVTLSYTVDGSNQEVTCKWHVHSPDGDATAARFEPPADSRITVGTPAGSFVFVDAVKTALLTTGVEAGDAIALFVKPSPAPTADLTLTMVCSGGHVGSVTWPANSAKLLNLPYIASPQCGTESCQWFVTSSDASVAAAYALPVDGGKWQTIPIATQTQAYKQWRNQVRIAARKP